MFVSPSGVLIVFSRCRISANNKKVIGCSDSLVAGTRRQNYNVTRLETKHLTLFVAKPYASPSPCYAEHFVCARMVVNIMAGAARLAPSRLTLVRRL